MEKIRYDVLIPAHGESPEQIETLLWAVSHQKSPDWKLQDILLCSDNPEIRKHFSDSSMVEFIPQTPKLGKPDALNKMLQRSQSSVAIQNSADCIPASEHTYDFLLNPLRNPSVGAVTSRPCPVNQGFMSLPNIVWKCHEFVQPKLNAELFSFRRELIKELPIDVIHDDAFIHGLLWRNHYAILYEPRAVVLNKAPSTFYDFYSQRKKNALGNIQLGKQFKMFPPKGLRLRSLILMSLELLANIHGRLDYIRGKIPAGLVGYNLESTKEVMQ